MLRGLLRRIGRDRTFRRRLPKSLGGARYLASTEGGLKHLRWNAHRIDPQLTNLAVQLVNPGCVVWDIGANVGLFSFTCAGLAGSSGAVVAVEADPWLVTVLHRSAQLNPELDVNIVPVALSDQGGIASFSVANRSRAANYLSAGGGTTQTDGVRQHQWVPCLTLDDLMGHFPLPDIVKIDVERLEDRVLMGGVEFLRESEATLILEVDDLLADKVSAILHGAGYVLHAVSETGSIESQPSTRATYTTVAKPRWRTNATEETSE